MRALVCTEYNDKFRVELQQKKTVTDIGANEVLIKVHYASVSHAVGLMIAGKYQTRPNVPFIPGTEAVGEIINIGSSVSRLKAGMMVLAVNNFGCYAEKIVVPEYTVYPIPTGLDPLQALPLPISYGTAYTSLFWRACLQPTDTVLVLGAGAGVGLAAVEVAAEAGAHVIACSSTAEKRQTALEHGASGIVSPTANLAEEVKGLTSGQGVSILFDPVGGELANKALRATAPNGQIISIGFASGSLPKYAPNYLLVKNLTLHGFFFGRYLGWTLTDERMQHAPALQTVMEKLFQWAVKGSIRPMVSKVYKLDQLENALQALKNQRVIGKVAISFI